MARRLLPIALLAALAIGGCTYGTRSEITSEQRQAREQLLRAADGFSDHELARLCRGLYPEDFLTNEDDYPREDEDHREPPVTEQLRALLDRAACDVPEAG